MLQRDSERESRIRLLSTRAQFRTPARNLLCPPAVYQRESRCIVCLECERSEVLHSGTSGLRTRAYADPEADRHSGTGNPYTVPQAYGDAVSGSGNSHSVT